MIARLGAALGLAGFDGSYDPRRTSQALAAAVPAFSGASLAALGDGGRPLAGSADA